LRIEQGRDILVVAISDLRGVDLGEAFGKVDQRTKRVVLFAQGLVFTFIGQLVQISRVLCSIITKVGKVAFLSRGEGIPLPGTT
jgi:hypothetical protein